MQDNTVTIAYYGTATFKITTAAGKKILIDPFISKNPLCKKKREYFNDVDLIIVSHGAFDHLGDTAEIMQESKAVLVCGAEVGQYVVKKGVDTKRIKRTIYGDSKEFDGVRLRMVYARHASRIDTGQETLYGVPMGIVLTTENNIRIYHVGDTAIFGDMEMIGRLYRPHILMVGVGAVSPEYASEMTPKEAAMAAQMVSPDVAIPMHYPPGSENPEIFRNVLNIIAPEIEPVMMAPNSEITYYKYRIG